MHRFFLHTSLTNLALPPCSPSFRRMKHGRKVVSYWRERGLSEGFAVFRQLKEIQAGELKGVDRYGNKYFEDPTAVTGRNRYVVYPSRKQVNASNVPPEWHGWLHVSGEDTLTPLTCPICILY